MFILNAARSCSNGRAGPAVRSGGEWYFRGGRDPAIRARRWWLPGKVQRRSRSSRTWFTNVAKPADQGITRGPWPARLEAGPRTSNGRNGSSSAAEVCWCRAGGAGRTGRRPRQVAGSRGAETVARGAFPLSLSSRIILRRGASARTAVVRMAKRSHSETFLRRNPGGIGAFGVGRVGKTKVAPGSPSAQRRRSHSRNFAPGNMDPPRTESRSHRPMADTPHDP